MANPLLNFFQIFDEHIPYTHWAFPKREFDTAICEPQTTPLVSYASKATPFRFAILSTISLAD